MRINKRSVNKSKFKYQKYWNTLKISDEDRFIFTTIGKFNHSKNKFVPIPQNNKNLKQFAKKLSKC